MINKLNGDSDITLEGLKEIGLTIKTILGIVECDAINRTEIKIQALQSDLDNLHVEFLECMKVYYLEKFEGITNGPKTKSLCKALAEYSNKNCWAKVVYDVGPINKFSSWSAYFIIFTGGAADDENPPNIGGYGRDRHHIKLMAKNPENTLFCLPRALRAFKDTETIPRYDSSDFERRSKNLRTRISKLEKVLKNPEAFLGKEKNKFIKKYLSKSKTGAVLLDLFDNGMG